MSSTAQEEGAAEEPEPQPGESSTSTNPPSYDPRDYQPPHPDDRGGGGGGKPTKKGGGAKGKGKGEGGKEGTAKNEDEDGTTHRCGNCNAPDAKSKCKGCGVEYYCNRECQTVGLGLRIGSAVGERR